jgi:hypothetical protein
MDALDGIDEARPTHPAGLVHAETAADAGDGAIAEREMRLDVREGVVCQFPVAVRHHLLPRGYVLLASRPFGEEEVDCRVGAWAVAHWGGFGGWAEDLDWFLVVGVCVGGRGRGGLWDWGWLDAALDVEPGCETREKTVPRDWGGVLGVEALVCAGGS